eukprot:TRINITY_DN44770_c0_g1_i1.p1 TRINITY_DN44770_c0_g1~~TRINITY_DN44770_c0_g1_i1.p1  ORF type:complete len:234 (+),score=22.44 TRINITY_DN44770_c0_g1_i1:33-704(+)
MSKIKTVGVPQNAPLEQLHAALQSTSRDTVLHGLQRFERQAEFMDHNLQSCAANLARLLCAGLQEWRQRDPEVEAALWRACAAVASALGVTVGQSLAERYLATLATLQATEWAADVITQCVRIVIACGRTVNRAVLHQLECLSLEQLARVLAEHRALDDAEVARYEGLVQVSAACATYDTEESALYSHLLALLRQGRCHPQLRTACAAALTPLQALLQPPLLV